MEMMQSNYAASAAAECQALYYIALYSASTKYTDPAVLLTFETAQQPINARFL